MNYPKTLVNSLSKIDKEIVRPEIVRPKMFDLKIGSIIFDNLENHGEHFKKVGIQCLRCSRCLKTKTIDICFIRTAKKIRFINDFQSKFTH